MCEMAFLDGIFEKINDGLDMLRFGDIIGAEFLSAALEVGSSAGGYKRYVQSGVYSSGLLNNLQSVHSRQIVVANQPIDGLASQRLQRLAAVGSAKNLKAVSRERALQRPALQPLVFD